MTEGQQAFSSYYYYFFLIWRGIYGSTHNTKVIGPKELETKDVVFRK